MTSDGLEASAIGGNPQAQLELGVRCLAAARDGGEAHATGMRWITEAAQQGLAEAQWMLGNIYAHTLSTPDAARMAYEWYAKAAAQHSAPAQDRLADLHMLGRGAPADDREAFRWYAKSAAQVLPVAQANLAYMHAHGIGTVADQDTATTWFLRAAAMGNARAYFNLGLRYAAGTGAPLSAVHAYAWLRNAADRDYPFSLAMAEKVGGQLSGGELASAEALAERIRSNLAEMRQRLGEAASSLDPGNSGQLLAFGSEVEAQFERLNDPALSLDSHRRGTTSGDAERNSPPVEPKAAMRSWRPRVLIIDDFLSLDECAHVMDLATSQLVPSSDYQPAQGSEEINAFNGDAMVFTAPLCDATLRNIERRIALHSRMPPDHIEPLSVLRYRPGHAYDAHVDFFREDRLRENELKGDHGGQRLLTFLIYLRAPEEGGETEYIKAGCTITGRTGMAGLHYNCLPSNLQDEMTEHRGRPIVRGEKWLLRTAIREHGLYGR